MEETKVIEEVTEEVTENVETTGAETETKTEEKTETVNKEELEKELKEYIDKQLGKEEEKTTETTEEIPEGPDAVLSDGLPIMAAGMMGIFVVIGIIIVTISVLAKLGGDNGYFSKGVKALFKKN